MVRVNLFALISLSTNTGSIDADYKKTPTCPTRSSRCAAISRTRAANAEELAGSSSTSAPLGAPRRDRFVLHAGRRTQRRYHIGTRQQDSEGHHRQEPDAVGVRRSYVPGWDCHGMPIEGQIEKTKARTAAKRRRSSPAPCDEQVERQKRDFIRSACSATGTTRISHGYQTRPTRSARSGSAQKGYVYRGLKP